jgi:uncharacterized protein YjbI with pentapeptide repeats
MHSTSADKGAEEFWQAIQKQLADSDFNFQEYVFPGRSSFEGTVFSDLADFSGAAFRNEAVFDGVRFLNGATFRRSAFSTSATFYEVEFISEWKTLSQNIRSRNTVSFNEALFGLTEFHALSFHSVVYFEAATFADRALFTDVRFADDAIFRNASFSTAVSFSKVRFAADADFGQTRFGSRALFEMVQFDDLAHFASADLPNVTFRSLDLSTCCFSDARDLDKAEFDHVTRWARWPPRPVWRRVLPGRPARDAAASGTRSGSNPGFRLG